MFITTSRKSNLLSKRFSKYLTIFLPGIEYLPRGKTNLKKLFEKARYLGHLFFLEVSFNKGNISLSIFSFKDDSFFLEREYLIDVLDLRHLRPFPVIKDFSESLSDSKKVFYFLSKKNLSSKSKFSLLEVEENIFNFFYDKEYLGFSFKLLNVKKID